MIIINESGLYSLILSSSPPSSRSSIAFLCGIPTPVLKCPLQGAALVAVRTQRASKRFHHTILIHWMRASKKFHYTFHIHWMRTATRAAPCCGYLRIVQTRGMTKKNAFFLFQSCYAHRHGLVGHLFQKGQNYSRKKDSANNFLCFP